MNPEEQSIAEWKALVKKLEREVIDRKPDEWKKWVGIIPIPEGEDEIQEFINFRLSSWLHLHEPKRQLFLKTHPGEKYVPQPMILPNIYHEHKPQIVEQKIYVEPPVQDKKKCVHQMVLVETSEKKKDTITKYKCGKCQSVIVYGQSWQKCELCNKYDLCHKCFIKKKEAVVEKKDEMMFGGAHDEIMKEQKEEKTQDQEYGTNGSGKIHLRVQQRAGRKNITILEGLTKEVDAKKLLGELRKTLAVGGSIDVDANKELIVLLHGDMRQQLKLWLVEHKVVSNVDSIVVHGA